MNPDLEMLATFALIAVAVMLNTLTIPRKAEANE